MFTVLNLRQHYTATQPKWLESKWLRRMMMMVVIVVMMDADEDADDDDYDYYCGPTKQ